MQAKLRKKNEKVKIVMVTTVVRQIGDVGTYRQQEHTSLRFKDAQSNHLNDPTKLSGMSSHALSTAEDVPPSSKESVQWAGTITKLSCG